MSKFQNLMLAAACMMGSEGDPTGVKQAVDQLNPYPASLYCLFENPAVIGASVSVGTVRSDVSPVSIIANKTGSEVKKDMMLAAHGQTSSESLANPVFESRIRSASIVVGVDFFFWDAVNGCHDIKSNLEKITTMASTTAVPLILGTIPSFTDKKIDESCRMKLNQQIKEGCLTNCHVIDLDKSVEGLLKKSGAQTDEEKKTAIKEHVPDGLHPDVTVLKHFSKDIEKLIKDEQIGCKDSTKESSQPHTR